MEPYKQSLSVQLINDEENNKAELYLHVRLQNETPIDEEHPDAKGQSENRGRPRNNVPQSFLHDLILVD